MPILSGSFFWIGFAALVAPQERLTPRAVTWRAQGEQAGAEFGRVLATGDVNGDGFGDLIVGAPLFDARIHDEGRVSLYLGSLSGLDAAPDWTAAGTQPFEHFGAALAIADVNGDGRDDLLVGAPDFDRAAATRLATGLGHAGSSTDEGRVALYLGTRTGLAPTPARVLTGNEPGAHLGVALGRAGDVNSDGFDDVLCGASGEFGGLGGAHLFAGSAAGLEVLPSWTRTGSSIGEGWGTVLGTVGDVDRDGFDDFVVSAPARGAHGVTEAFFGSALGPALTPDRTNTDGMSALGASANLDSNSLIETLYVPSNRSEVRWLRVWSANGHDDLPALPSSIGALTAGDLNGDGLLDVVASTPDFERAQIHGRVWTFTNQVGRGLKPLATFPVFDGEQAGEEWGAAMASIDVDGDGADELLIGAPKYGGGATDEGLVVLVPGHEADFAPGLTGQALTLGLPRSGDFDGDGASDIVSISPDGTDQLEVRYGTSGGLPLARDAVLNCPTNFGDLSLLEMELTTGDFDGDGYADALVTQLIGIGGPYPQPTDGGHSLYRGSPSGLELDAATTLRGLGHVMRIGDVNGDGRDDVALDLGDSVEIHFGVSTGLATAADQIFPPVLAVGHAVLAGDLDGDRFGDVIMIQHHSGLAILLGSPTGLVLQSVQELGSVSGSFVFLTDVSGDGLGDLLQLQGHRLGAYLNTPAGFVHAKQWWEDPLDGTNSYFATPVEAVFDADRDGHEDFLIYGTHLHRGSAHGVERQPSWSGLDDLTRYVALDPVSGDFDGDGQVEILTHTTSSTSVWQALEFARR